jgi:hypothetical protein
MTTGSGSVTFAVATFGSGDVVEGNFLSSPCFRQAHGHQILIQRDYPSAASAYNTAIERSANDLIVLAHQDVILPGGWLSDLKRALDELESLDPNWGVLGCYGVGWDGAGRGCVYSPGWGMIGTPLGRPVAVQTLDEIVLVLRRSSGLRFDPSLPHFHLYGADICLRAASLGMKSYAIPALCIHNAHQYLALPKEFYTCCRHFQRVWKHELPVRTTCVKITRFGLWIYLRRLQEARLRCLGKPTFLGPRSEDTSKLLADAEAAASALCS